MDLTLSVRHGSDPEAYTTAFECPLSRFRDCEAAFQQCPKSRTNERGVALLNGRPVSV